MGLLCVSAALEHSQSVNTLDLRNVRLCIKSGWRIGSELLVSTTRLHATKRVQSSTPPPALWPEGRARLGDDVRNADYFSRTIVKEPGRAAGRTTHPEFRVALQPSPFRVIPSSVPVTGTDSVAPSLERKTPSLASRRPH